MTIHRSIHANPTLHACMLSDGFGGMPCEAGASATTAAMSVEDAPYMRSMEGPRSAEVGE